MPEYMKRGSNVKPNRIIKPDWRSETYEEDLIEYEKKLNNEKIKKAAEQYIKLFSDRN